MEHDTATLARSRHIDTAWRDRALRVKHGDSNFIPHADFTVSAKLREPAIVAEVLAARGSQEPEQAPAGLPPHLQRLCEAGLLSFEQEQAIFRAMNYRRFRVAALRERLELETPCPVLVAELEQLLGEVQALRDYLVKANMRLVISIVKKFVTPQRSFDEMLSDGLVTLMIAVDKFDYDRGFRFSTYAYRCIARTAYRAGQRQANAGIRMVTGGDAWAIEVEASSDDSSLRDGLWSNLRHLTSGMIDRLDRREKFIIRCRYALGSHRKVKTLQHLADTLGVSKERVRQLEIRAVTKLRNMAAEIELDDQLGSALL